MGGNSIDYTLFTISGHLLKIYEGSRSLDITKEQEHYIDKDVKGLYDNLHGDVTALVKNFLDSVWCYVDDNKNLHDIEIEYTTFRLKLKEETKFDRDSLYLKEDVIDPYFYSLYLEEMKEEKEEHRIKRSIAEEYNCLLKHCFDSVNPNTRHVIQVYSNAKEIYERLNYVKEHELYRDTEELRFHLSRVIYDCLSIMHKVDIYVKYYLLAQIVNELRQGYMVGTLYEYSIKQPPLRDISSINPDDIDEYDLYLNDVGFISSLPYILEKATIEQLQRDLADTIVFMKYKDYKYLKAIQMVLNYSDDYFKERLESKLDDNIKKYNLVWNDEYKKFCFENINPRNMQWSDKEEVDKKVKTKEEQYEWWMQRRKISNLVSTYHEYLLR